MEKSSCASFVVETKTLSKKMKITHMEHIHQTITFLDKYKDGKTLICPNPSIKDLSKLQEALSLEDFQDISKVFMTTSYSDIQKYFSPDIWKVVRRINSKRHASLPNLSELLEPISIVYRDSFDWRFANYNNQRGWALDINWYQANGELRSVLFFIVDVDFDFIKIFLNYNLWTIFDSAYVTNKKLLESSCFQNFESLITTVDTSKRLVTYSFGIGLNLWHAMQDKQSLNKDSELQDCDIIYFNGELYFPEEVEE